MMDINELLDGFPMTPEYAPLILGMAVNEINAAPIDYRTRMRTYDQFCEALKERLKEGGAE